MAKIVINVPADRATEALEVIIDQINEGFTSGHHDAANNWDVEFDSSETPDDLA